MVVAFYFRLHLAYFPRPVVAIFARPEHGGLAGRKKPDFSRVCWRERSGSGLAAVRSQHNFSTLDARVLKLKVCSSKDVFLFTGRAYTHNCSEGNERKVNHAGCKSGSPE